MDSRIHINGEALTAKLPT